VEFVSLIILTQQDANIKNKIFSVLFHSHDLSVENGSGVGITEFVDFVDHLIFWENTAVRKLDLKMFTSSD
jgi:hypothetical protein